MAGCDFVIYVKRTKSYTKSAARGDTEGSEQKAGKKKPATRAG
jgi:hypothetical protein